MKVEEESGIEPDLPTIIWKESEMEDMDWVADIDGAHFGDIDSDWERRHIFSNGERIGLEMGIYYALYQFCSCSNNMKVFHCLLLCFICCLSFNSNLKKPLHERSR